MKNQVIKNLAYSLGESLIQTCMEQSQGVEKQAGLLISNLWHFVLRMVVAMQLSEEFIKALKEMDASPCGAEGCTCHVDKARFRDVILLMASQSLEADTTLKNMRGLFN